MALDTYANLKTSVLSWMDRAGDTNFVAQGSDIVTLAESKLNRLIGVIETDATLTGVLSSRLISISALSIVSPVALFATYYTTHETELTPKADGTYEEVLTDGKARYWSIDGTNIVFDRTLDSAYSFRFRYDQRFALSNSVTTNWLLTNYPDIYLAACLMWGAGYNEDWPNGQVWKGILDEGIPEVRNIIARSRKGNLTVDPALQGIGRRWRDNSWANEI